MKVNKESYFITESARKRFRRWLFNNDLSFSEFAKRCGVSRQYLDRAIKGLIPINNTVRQHFKNGGYDVL